MATAVIAGIAAYGAGYSVAAAAVVAAVAAGAQMVMENNMSESATSQTVSLGDSASSIDKTSLQQQSEIGKLELGENAKDKKKRKKGKAAFKIALDKAAQDSDTGSPSTGVVAPESKSAGIQL